MACEHDVKLSYCAVQQIVASGYTTIVARLTPAQDVALLLDPLR